jgi:hypothetical protein
LFISDCGKSKKNQNKSECKNQTDLRSMASQMDKMPTSTSSFSPSLI